MIPLFKVRMEKEASERVSAILNSGYVGEGPISRQFEAEIGNFISNPNVVLTNSGTAAITMALRLAGVGQGDYVVSTPMTCLATNEPILSLGASPIWADINGDGCLDPDSTDMAIKSAPVKPKAVICMDWGGEAV